MFGRQPHLPIDATLGLAPQTIMEPNTTKFVQKIREHTSGLIKKLKHFKLKRHNVINYDKQGRAVALQVRDTVLVSVTTFKGCHKMQDQWENREYVVEKQPYPNVPVYVVHPREGKGTARPYIGTICFLLALI